MRGRSHRERSHWEGGLGDLVLRGHLACPACSDGEPRLITGSLSRGRRGGRYAYYHCHRCGGFRVRAEEAHDAFRDTEDFTPLGFDDLLGREWPVSDDDLVVSRRFFKAMLEFDLAPALVGGHTDDPYVHHDETRIWIVDSDDTFATVADAATALAEKSAEVHFACSLGDLLRLVPLWHQMDFDERADMLLDHVLHWINNARHLKHWDLVK